MTPPRSTLAPDQPDYPVALADLVAPPSMRVSGTLPRPPGVAIVGTRRPTEAARAFARALAGDLARAGVVIWSGGAVGIDTAAHEGALDAGGLTVVVLGAGLDRPFPPENVQLFARVTSAGGALVSLVEDATPAANALFLARNRVLAAATRATVIVQCAFRSGARSTARHARNLGRPCGVVPHSPWDAHGGGNLLELGLGARIVCDAGAVLDLAGLPNPGAQLSLFETREVEAFDPLAGLEPALRTVADAVRAGATTLDAICDATSLPAYQVARSLAALAVASVVVDTQHGLALALRRAPPHKVSESR